jgi:hypothetical protein
MMCLNTCLTLLLAACYCRQASRTAILRVLTSLMPARMPFGFSQYHDSPAEWLTTMVDRQIARFQASVTERAAEHRAETRWWWHRRWDKLAANFRCVRGGARSHAEDSKSGQASLFLRRHAHAAYVQLVAVC